MHGAAIYSLLTAFFMGAPRVLTRTFDPAEVLRLIEAEKITGVTVVGDAIARPIAEAIREHGDRYDLSSLKLRGSGGALFSPKLKDELRELVPGLVIKDAFGASETGNDGIVEFGDDGTKRIRFNPNAARRAARPTTAGPRRSSQPADATGVPHAAPSGGTRDPTARRCVVTTCCRTRSRRCSR